MKKIFVFILGMITGVILFCVISYFVVYVNSKGRNYNIPGLTMFENAGEILPYKSFEVFQVLPSGGALVKASTQANEKYFITSPMAFILPPQSGGYYDEQRLKTPSGKTVRQVGTYSYTTNIGYDKTVPVLGFYDQ